MSITPILDRISFASELAAYSADRISSKIIVITGVSRGSLSVSYVKHVVKSQPAIFTLAG